MKLQSLLFLLFPRILLSGNIASAQQMGNPPQKAYFSTGIDGYILSTTLKQRTGESLNLSTPRFTGFVNIGVHINYDFSRHSGIYTGLGIKNIGFIEKFNNPDYTIKHRVYTIGVPLGLKLGDVRYGSYLIVGGGLDLPFNYREKAFEKRSDKQKFNEWFSDRTPAVMPYVFVGVHLRPLLAFKLQYYPANFMNRDFTVNGIKPYQDYDVRLIMLTLGIDIPYRPKG